MGAAARVHSATSSCGLSSRLRISLLHVRDVVSRSTTWRLLGHRDCRKTARPTRYLSGTRRR